MAGAFRLPLLQHITKASWGSSEAMLLGPKLSVQANASEGIYISNIFPGRAVVVALQPRACLPVPPSIKFLMS